MDNKKMPRPLMWSWHHFVFESISNSHYAGLTEAFRIAIVMIE